MEQAYDLSCGAIKILASPKLSNRFVAFVAIPGDLLVSHNGFSKWHLYERALATGFHYS